VVSKASCGHIRIADQHRAGAPLSCFESQVGPVTIERSPRVDASVLEGYLPVRSDVREGPQGAMTE